MEKKQIVRDRSVFPLFTYEAKNVQPIVVVHTLKEIFVAVHVVGLYSRLHDHSGLWCGRADHTTTVILPVVLSHNHNHSI